MTDNTNTTLNVGNVGIGVTPSYKLHVNGSGFFTDSVYIKGAKNRIYSDANGTNMIVAVDSTVLGVFDKSNVAFRRGTNYSTVKLGTSTCRWNAVYSETGNFSGAVTISAATAPLVITSTTKVNNLNADLLDGYHAADLDYSFSVGEMDEIGYTEVESDPFIQLTKGTSDKIVTSYFQLVGTGTVYISSDANGVVTIDG
jgi:hypothetical protein